VELDINESDIPRVRVGQQCSLAPESYPDKIYRAGVREIAPEAKPAEGDHPGEGRHKAIPTNTCGRKPTPR